MKVEIIIEQFDNGISLKWKDVEGEEDSQNEVALDRDKEKAIGEMILEDIKNLMDCTPTNKVVMRIEYATESKKDVRFTDAELAFIRDEFACIMESTRNQNAELGIINKCCLLLGDPTYERYEDLVMDTSGTWSEKNQGEADE